MNSRGMTFDGLNINFDDTVITEYKSVHENNPTKSTAFTRTSDAVKPAQSRREFVKSPTKSLAHVRSSDAVEIRIEPSSFESTPATPAAEVHSSVVTKRNSLYNLPSVKKRWPPAPSTVAEKSTPVTSTRKIAPGPAGEEAAQRGPEQTTNAATVEAIPAVVEEETSAVVEEETLVVLEAETPAAAEAKTPAVVEEETPAVVEAETPTVAEAETPAVAEAETLTLVEAETLTVVEEKTPAPVETQEKRASTSVGVAKCTMNEDVEDAVEVIEQQAEVLADAA
eukprot:GEMP01013881.1.p1 GENE.GEMP01013881.1~~GEMP01013881.1.p1  ORF type:complete len:282 (+),score=105.56 GEMP01013881.1:131-976(+)